MTCTTTTRMYSFPLVFQTFWGKAVFWMTQGIRTTTSLSSHIPEKSTILSFGT